MKRSQLTSSTTASRNSVYNGQQEQEEEEEEEIGQVYQPQSPYYSPVHSLKFYDDE